MWTGLFQDSEIGSQLMLEGGVWSNKLRLKVSEVLVRTGSR